MITIGEGEWYSLWGSSSRPNCGEIRRSEAGKPGMIRRARGYQLRGGNQGRAGGRRMGRVSTLGMERLDKASSGDDDRVRWDELVYRRAVRGAV